MPTWARYPKIVESTQQFTGSTSGEWIVTEKVHGANFSVIVSGDDVSFASRGSILAASDNFFGFRSHGLAERLAPCARALRESLLAAGRASSQSSVIVYGELCGGGYPHGEVAAVPGSAPVQRGCWYSSEIIFVGFDVAIGCEEAQCLTFLGFDVAREAATSAGLRFAAPLFRGELAHCLSQPVRFVSTLPAALGLPPLPDNWAEGVVVRPASEPPSPPRRMFKLKIAEFSEKQYQNDEWRDARHGGTSAAAQGGRRGGRVRGSADDEEEKESTLRYELLAATTTQRLDNVRSKIGHVNPSDKRQCRRLLDELVRDVEESLVDDGLLAQAGMLRTRHATLHGDLEAAARKLVVAFLRAELRAPGHADGRIVDSPTAAALPAA